MEASLKPQISLSGYFGYNYDIDDSLHKENLWQIGLNLTWNIFDFNRGDAREQQARVAKLQAVIQKKRLSEDFNKMLAEAVDRVESSVAEYKINLAQLKLLEETENIEEARYGARSCNSNELLLAKGAKTLHWPNPNLGEVLHINFPKWEILPLDYPI